MLLMIREILITSCFIHIVSCGISTDKYVFKKETISMIIPTKDDIPNYDKHYLVQLKDEEQKNLCMAAKQSAKVDGMLGPGIFEPTYEVNKYSITYLGKKEVENDVALRCETIPRSYLQLDKRETSGKEIRVLFEVNSFDTYTYKYKVEYIQSEPVITQAPGDPEVDTSKVTQLKVNEPENEAQELNKLKIDESTAEISKDTPETAKPKVESPKIIQQKKPPQPKVERPEIIQHKKPPLLRMWAHDRTDLCVAAKRRTKLVVPVLQRSEVEKPRWYNFKYSDGREDRKLMAIDCSSIPPMYVYFRNGRHEVQIIVVYPKRINPAVEKKMLDSLEK